VRDTTEIPAWVRRSGYCTDGTRLFQITSLSAQLVADSRGAPISVGGAAKVQLDDVSHDIGALQPGLELSVSELVATMRPVEPGA
jgi:hypothetical protein